LYGLFFVYLLFIHTFDRPFPAHSWDSWDFHVGYDSRAGPIISLASYYDVQRKKHRTVLYKGFISELFVPYQDPTEEWYYKTFFDGGEYGLGRFMSPLKASTDCPSDASFINAYYASSDGTPVEIPNAFCIFEKYAGGIMWRHTEAAIPNELVPSFKTSFLFFSPFPIILLHEHSFSSFW